MGLGVRPRVVDPQAGTVQEVGMGGMLGFPDVGRATPAWKHLGRGFLHRLPNPPYGVD